MSYFSQKGKPLDDDRLTLSDTTKAGSQQYRIWKDGHQVLVPKGQSTTRPNASENVQVNTGVHGYIKKGYFNPPIVEFRNSTNFNLFDRFIFKVWRDGDELPTDPEIPWEDLGIKKVTTSVFISFKSDNAYGMFDNNIDFVSREKNVWESQNLHMHDYNLNSVSGIFYLVTNPTPYDYSRGVVINTGKILKKTNLPVYAVVSEVYLNKGNSRLKLLLHNFKEFQVKVDEATIKVLGGE